MIVEHVIQKFSDESGNFKWGLETAMKSLVGESEYAISASNGSFEVITWNEENGVAPTGQQIRDEYIRHRTIAECLEYFNSKQTNK